MISYMKTQGNYDSDMCAACVRACAQISAAAE
jgi:hypothetical protein